MKKFKGFTLSELMVAMAIIGVLVAVVTPAIMKNRPNKNKMMVKKSFYATEQIVNNLINEEAIYPDMRIFCNGDTPSSDAEYCAFGFDYTEGAVSDGLYYEGEYKFGALFKSRLNVKSDDTTSGGTTIKNPVKPSTNTTFYPIFYSTDGIKWDLTGTKGAWTARKNDSSASVGTFGTQNTHTTGIGTITIDVNGDEAPNVFCTAANEDCDKYTIQILANGKMRINPTYTRAVNYATINTSIKDQ